MINISKIKDICCAAKDKRKIEDILYLRKTKLPYIFGAFEIAYIQNKGNSDRIFLRRCEEICKVCPEQYLVEGLHWYENCQKSNALNDFLKNTLLYIISSIITIFMGILGAFQELKELVLLVALIYLIPYIIVMCIAISHGKKIGKYAYYASIIQHFLLSPYQHQV